MQTLLGAALHASANAVIITNTSGIFEWVNPAFLDLSGYSMEEVLGRNPNQLVKSGKQSDAFYSDLWRTISAGNSWHGDLTNRRKDGSLYQMEMTISPIKNLQGEITHYVSIQQDISKRKAAEEALQKSEKEMMHAKERAEAAVRAKSEFLASMSHEIRTPMNGIFGMTELALDTELSGEQREYLTLIKTSADSLMHVINNILDYSKIEAGRMILQSAEFSLEHLVREIIKSLSAEAKNKKLELVLAIDPNIPAGLMGDAGLLRQVILNLVANAIKFTESGKVEVEVQCIAQLTLTQVNLHFSVRDTGIGIPQEKCRSILETFAQADSSDTRKYGGTGLGLAISSRLIEMMGGKLQLDSELGVGSTFCFNLTFNLALPAQHGAQAHPTFEPQAEQGVGRVRLRTFGEVNETQFEFSQILLAEDNEVNRAVILRQLKMLGYTVDIAEDGVIALDKWGRNHYDLLLTDLQMPNMSGFELAAEVRKKAVTNDCRPIVVITANVMEEQAKYSSEYGIDDFMFKPFSLRDLEAMLRKHLPHINPVKVVVPERAEKANSKQIVVSMVVTVNSNTEMPEDLSATLPIFDSTTLVKLIGDDAPALRRLLEKFLKNAQDQIVIIENASTTSKITAIADTAHKLKSAARSVGTLRVGHLCQELETAARAGDSQQCNILVKQLLVEFPSALSAVQKHLEI